MMEVMQCGPNWNMMIQKWAEFGSFSEYIWGFTRGRTYPIRRAAFQPGMVCLTGLVLT